jgi:hypothetical protein
MTTVPQIKEPKMRTNTQVPLSFGRDEKMLLSLLDEERKKTGETRSGWVKSKIREAFMTKTLVRG